MRHCFRTAIMVNFKIELGLKFNLRRVRIMNGCHRVSSKRTFTWCWILAILLTHAAYAAVSGAPEHLELAKLPANFHRLSGPEAVQPMPSELVSGNLAAVQMRFFEPPLESGMVTKGNRDWETIRLSGEGAITEPGAPELPMVSRLIMVGNRGRVTLRVQNQSFTVMDNIEAVMPAQHDEGDENAPANGFTAPKAEIYGADAWYPPTIAEISTPATLRDVRFVALTLFPVQINPVTRQMRVYDNIEVVVETGGGAGENEVVHTPRFISPDFLQLYRTFENFRSSALDELPVMPGRYLAICPNSANAIAHTQKLVDWKRRRGIDASYVTTATTGTSASAIRTYIRNQYFATNGELEFVCLVGDPNGSSGYILATEGTQKDNYFGVLNANEGPNPDPVPDIAIGRISCGDNTKMLSTVDKTIRYESNPYLTDPSWFTRTWCVAHTQYIASNPSTKEYTRQIMLQHGVTSAAFNTYVSHISTTDMNARITQGMSVFNHRMSWIGQISNTDVDGTPVTFMNPFVMSVTCGTGNFDGDGTSEHWLAPAGQTSSNPKGAIGCVGMHGSGTHTRFNNIVDAGVMYGLYALDIETQGAALIAGKLELYRNYWTTNPTDVNNFCYWSNLMGDPAVPVWRKRPVPPRVTTRTTIDRGTNNLAVQVANSENLQPIAGAFVCLQKGAETYSRGYTDAAGNLNLPCSTATTGYLYVTVTKDDLQTYVDSVQVVNSAASLAYSSVDIDDDNTGGTVGDNNDVLNPGETIDLRIVLTNSGTSSTVTGISGTLTSSSAGIQITQAASTYPNIAPGATANPATPFRIVVTSIFNREPVTFFLNLTSSAGTQSVRLDLTPVAGDVTFVSSTFSGPGGSVDPGESGGFTVTFQNSGNRSLTTAAGVLRSLDAYISVTDSVGSYGTVSAASNSTNTTNPYAITASAGAYNGHRAQMQLVVTAAGGFRDSTNFTLTIGNQTTTSPTGPDAYGYYAFDNTENQPPNSGSVYEWIELYPTPGTSLNFNDNGENQDVSTVLTLPFTFQFYGQTFNQITVCSNGWLAFGAYTITDFRNYRMGSPLGPPYQVAAYWDDLAASGAATNVYYWYDETNHLYVVEWRCRTLWTSVNEYFEIILYDPAFYGSATGDGKIKVQYNTVNLSPNQDGGANDDNLYASVGIQNGDHSIGLDYYYWNSYSPGSASLVAGRSIMYTTDATGQLSPAIHLTQPDGGEQWYVGQTYNVLWQTTAVPGNVNIQLNRNYPGGAWETVIASTANDGEQAWTIAGAAAANARIRVVSINNPAVGDTSDANFTIITPTVTLIAPNGGEVLATGSTYTMLWTSVGLGPATVELNRNYPVGTWEVLSSSAADVLQWTVSGMPTANARVRITGISLPSVTDISDGNFTIGVAPVVTHNPHADLEPGTALFTAFITDDVAGFTPRLLYRLLGAGSYDSLTMTATGNPNEFSATTPVLTPGRYEYFLRATDAQLLSTVVPATGTYKFDVHYAGSVWAGYDDGTAENYNWTQGPGFKWAVRFDPGSYPYALCAGRFAACPQCLAAVQDPVIFTVYLADGPGGMPGTVVFRDTTGSPGNVAGGLPGGAAWANVVTRTGGHAIQVNGPFYLAVENNVPLGYAVAFGTDTLGTRANQSYMYDACTEQWFNETTATGNNRPGNRMIRAVGFPMGPVQVVVYREVSGPNVNAILRWMANGAPYYRVYSSTSAAGPFDTLEGSTTGAAVGTPVTFTDVNAINEGVRRFYQVVASDAP